MSDSGPGKRLHGHTLLEKIGEGGYAEVWKARYLDQTVALKVLRPGAKTEDLQSGLIAQYRLGRLKGEDAGAFPRVEHIDLEADPPYVRMEFVAGCTLREHLRCNPTLSLKERYNIGRAILQALAVIHRNGLVHGDLSPANVMVTPEGRIKLIDVGFGVSSAPPGPVERSTDAVQMLGVASPSYAAPERGTGDFRKFGKQSDVFSFGKTLYHTLTGRDPSTLLPVSKLAPGLGEPWDDFVFRCVEEDPEARFADAAEAWTAWCNLPVPGEGAPTGFVADCPACKVTLLVPEDWLGKEIDCRKCGAKLEVLYFDVDLGKAEVLLRDGDHTFSVGAPPGGVNTVIQAPPRTRPRRNASAPGRPSDTSGRAEPQREDFTLRALLAFCLFLFFWLPGAVATAYFLSEAKRVLATTGRRPIGMDFLQVMMWVFVYVPFGIVLFCAFFLLILF